MNCINFRKRNKKGKRYFYCIYNKEEITFNNCKTCPYKEYKFYKPIRKRTNKLNKKEKERYSIIYTDLSKCCECGSKIGIEKNEIFEGAYRQTSIRLGMVAPMCRTHHRLFHDDIMFNLYYKVMFQKEYMKTHSLDDFISTFGQDYIFKLEHKKRHGN